MLRDEMFGSGLPLLLASICLLNFSYLAFVRREKLAWWWAAAWALLLTRIVLNTTQWPTSFIVSMAKSTLRTAFAVTVLAGAMALRGRRPQWLLMGLASVALPIAGEALGPLAGVLRVDAVPVMAGTVIMQLWAAWLLAEASDLPATERRSTAAALALYTVLSPVASLASSGSTVFTTAFMGVLGAEVMVASGLLATFFRLSHEAQLAALRATDRRLTTALGEFVSVCMHCKAVRDEHEQWQPLERYVSNRGHSQLSHGLCPTCLQQHYGDLA